MSIPSAISTADADWTLTSIERTVAELWGEVLGRETPIQPTDNFFDLGGDSMAMVMLEYRIQAVFDIQLSAAALLDAGTLHEFSVLVSTELGVPSDSENDR